MSTNENGKRDRDELIVASLASGATYMQAAKASGVSKATVARRMTEPAFRVRVWEQRERVIDQVRGSLTAAAPAAAVELERLATEAASESIKLRACLSLLELVLRRRPGLDTLSRTEATTIVTELVEIGLRYAPEETHEALVRDVMAFGDRF